MIRPSRGGRRRLLLLAASVVAAGLWLAADGPAPGPDAWLAPEGLTPGYLDAGGVRVRYVRTGVPGAPPLVLVHGILSSVYTWRDVLPELARTHDVAALDLPGFGGSAQPPDLGWRQLPTAVLALLDHLGWSRAALVGHSMGGAVAVVVAAESPGRVSRLVLVDAAGFHLAPQDRPGILRVLAVPWLAPLTDHWPWRRGLVWLGLRQVFHDDAGVTRERVDAYWACAARPGATAAVRSLLADVPGMAFEELVRSVEAPTLVVWGREDTWVPLSDAERFVTTLRRAELRVVEACGHVPQEENSRAFLEAVIPFLHAETRLPE